MYSVQNFTACMDNEGNETFQSAHSYRSIDWLWSILAFVGYSNRVQNYFEIIEYYFHWKQPTW